MSDVETVLLKGEEVYSNGNKGRKESIMYRSHGTRVGEEGKILNLQYKNTISLRQLKIAFYMGNTVMMR